METIDEMKRQTEEFFSHGFAWKAALKPAVKNAVRGYFGQGVENLEGLLSHKAGDGAAPKKIDAKEMFDMKGHPAMQGDSFRHSLFFDAETPWPSDLPDFKLVMMAYQRQVLELGRR